LAFSKVLFLASESTKVLNYRYFKYCCIFCGSINH